MQLRSEPLCGPPWILVSFQVPLLVPWSSWSTQVRIRMVYLALSVCPNPACPVQACGPSAANRAILAVRYAPPLPQCQGHSFCVSQGSLDCAAGPRPARFCWMSGDGRNGAGFRLHAASHSRTLKVGAGVWLWESSSPHFPWPGRKVLIVHVVGLALWVLASSIVNP